MAPLPGVPTPDSDNRKLEIHMDGKAVPVESTPGLAQIENSGDHWGHRRRLNDRVCSVFKTWSNYRCRRP
jgi:hypothetical protein